MTLIINSVKTLLCETGREMDATDISEALSTWARFPGGINRNQASNALQALCATDPDVVRTRKGLYRYRAAVLSSAHETINHAAPAIRSDEGDHPSPTSAHDHVAPATRQLALLLVADTDYVQAQLGDSTPTTPDGKPDIPALSAYLLRLADERYARRTEIDWHSGSIAAAAAMTRHQYRGQDIIAIAEAKVASEAAATAQRLGQRIRHWTVGDDTPPLAGNEISDTFHLRREDLVKPTQRQEPRTVTATSGATPRPRLAATGLARGLRPRDASDFDSLSYLDDVLYRRPIEHVTGHGNAHTLKRQAILVGSTYAARWLSVVNDETRERLLAANDGMRVPGRLYGDLIRFSELHCLPPHDSDVIKNHLRRGFWQAARGDSRPAARTAA